MCRYRDGAALPCIRPLCRLSVETGAESLRMRSCCQLPRRGRSKPTAVRIRRYLERPYRPRGYLWSRRLSGRVVHAILLPASLDLRRGGAVTPGTSSSSGGGHSSRAVPSDILVDSPGRRVHEAEHGGPMVGRAGFRKIAGPRDREVFPSRWFPAFPRTSRVTFSRSAMKPG